MKKRVLSLLAVLLSSMILSFLVIESANAVTYQERMAKLHERIERENVSLVPVNDYISLLNENGINLSLPDYQYKEFEDRDYYSYEIGQLFYLTYNYWIEGDKYSIALQAPNSYKGREEAQVLLIASVTGIEKTEAEKLYRNLDYNAIRKMGASSREATIEKAGNKFNYSDYGDFVILDVTHSIK